jgi:hypothetical protein
MDATAVAVGSAVLAAIIAVTVPRLTFRLAMRQDHDRWLRDQKSALYVDLLTEANAEARYIRHAAARPEVRERAAEFFAAADVRLPPLERARLGARGSIFGSPAVNELFNKLLSVGSEATLGQHDDDGTAANMRVGELMDKLEAMVRHELRADRIRLHDPG